MGTLASGVRLHPSSFCCIAGRRSVDGTPSSAAKVRHCTTIFSTSTTRMRAHVLTAASDRWHTVCRSEEPENSRKDGPKGPPTGWLSACSTAADRSGNSGRLSGGGDLLVALLPA